MSQVVELLQKQRIKLENAVKHIRENLDTIIKEQKGRIPKKEPISKTFSNYDRMIENAQKVLVQCETDKKTLERRIGRTANSEEEEKLKSKVPKFKAKIVKLKKRNVELKKSQNSHSVELVNDSTWVEGHQKLLDELKMYQNLNSDLQQKVATLENQIQSTDSRIENLNSRIQKFRDSSNTTSAPRSHRSLTPAPRMKQSEERNHARVASVALRRQLTVNEKATHSQDRRLRQKISEIEIAIGKQERLEKKINSQLEKRVEELRRSSSQLREAVAKKQKKKNFNQSSFN